MIKAYTFTVFAAEAVVDITKTSLCAAVIVEIAVTRTIAVVAVTKAIAVIAVTTAAEIIAALYHCGKLVAS